jgi:hypothetical protein
MQQNLVELAFADTIPAKGTQLKSQYERRGFELIDQLTAHDL